MINRQSTKLVCLSFALALATAASADGDAFALRTVSSRADLVSGGDALIEVSLPRGIPRGNVRIAVDGRDVTSAFRPGLEDGKLLGVVSGLAVGRNTVELWPNSHSQGHAVASLVVTNHPITGPVISGPHQTPFVCEAQSFGLTPVDADCSVNTKVDYFYRSTTANAFLALDPSAPRPADLAQTTTSDGVTVPYIVRREMGTVNRAVYVIAFLHQPGTPLPTPWSGTPGWNNRLIYSFGGGCRAGYHQGASVGGFNAAGNLHLEESQVGYKDYLLARGYAVIGTSLNVFGTSCADLISAESAMMLKEYFVKRFGVPRYTIGAGGSGGSMQQSMIGSNYPGLLDGVIPGRVYPDIMEFFLPLSDCELLQNAFNTSSLTWTDAQKALVSGYKNFNYCVNNGTRYPNLRANNCAPVLPPSLVFDPVTNPHGARCTYQDNMVNVYGTDSATGYARRPFDNVGVQYGLGALNAGAISWDQFVDLNARAGGHDINGGLSPNRTVADLQALATSYRTGRITQGYGGLLSTPIIDLRSYLDGTGDVHDAHHSKIFRARLTAANGNADNQVQVMVASLGTLGADIGGMPGVASSPLQVVTRAMLGEMDQWLAHIRDDHSNRSAREKVIRNKPADLVDSCYTADLQRITDKTQCAQLFPYYSEPRIVAGEPWTAEHVKCALKPIDARDYANGLTAAQLARLQAIFPAGVCDYSRPPVEQQPLQGTWLTYPGNGEVRELPRE